MTNKEFVDAVRSKLISAELPTEYIDQQCEKLLVKINELPEENAKKYTLEQNVDVFVEKITKKFQPKENDSVPEPSSDEKTRTVDIPQQEETSETSVETTVYQPAVKKKSSSDTIVIFDNSSDMKKKKNLSLSLSFGNGISSDNTHPVLLFSAILLLLAPVGILFLGLSFIVFLCIFLALAASIIAIIAVIIGVVAAGSLVSVASLLYGATQIISEPRYVGIHEIGLGLLVAGITILVSVILYNIALRLVPFIYAKLITFISFSAKKVRELFIKAKKGCENL